MVPQIKYESLPFTKLINSLLANYPLNRQYTTEVDKILHMTQIIRIAILNVSFYFHTACS